MVTLCLCSTWISPMGCCLFPADPMWVSHRLQFSKHCSSVGLYHRTHPSGTAHMDPHRQQLSQPSCPTTGCSFCSEPASVWALHDLQPSSATSTVALCFPSCTVSLLKSALLEHSQHCSCLSSVSRGSFLEQLELALTWGSAGTAHRGHFCSVLLPTLCHVGHLSQDNKTIRIFISSTSPVPHE